MFQSKRKIIILTIILTMSLVLFIGCDNSKISQTPESSQIETSSGESSATPAEGGPFEGLKFNPEEINLDGKKMVILIHGGLPPKDDPENSAAVNATWARYEKVEELYNVTIEPRSFINVDDMIETLISEFLAGVKSADVFSTASAASTPMFEKMGMVKPLDDYIDFSHPEWNQLENITFIDGKHYYLSKNVIPTTQMTIYNKDILQREGIEDIMAIYEKGEWTWEKMTEIMRQVTKDTTNDGLIDQFGFMTNNTMPALLASNGVQKIMIDGNELKMGLYTDKAMEVFDFYRNLTFENKYHTTLDSDFSDGNVLFSFGYSWHVAWWKSNMSMESVRTAPLPKGPSADEDVIITEALHVNLLPTISDFTTEEAIKLFLHATYNDPNDPGVYIDPEFAYVSGNSEYFNSVEEVEFWYNYCRTKPLLLDYSQGLPTIQNAVNVRILGQIQGGELPATVLESTRSMFENALKDVMAD